MSPDARPLAPRPAGAGFSVAATEGVLVAVLA
jgi:hypothetical protein